MAKKAKKDGAVGRNRKARLRFEILETEECGILLTGTEVKSLRNGQCSLDEAFARIFDGEVWLYGCHIPPYQHGNVHNHDPLRRRKLLLHKRQIEKLVPKVREKGQTLVPLEVYFNDRGLAKVTLALAGGKTQRDKRQDIQKREAQREIDRALRRRR